MGAYAYCARCHESLDRPTPLEIGHDNWRCINGHYNELRHEPLALLAEWVQDLLDAHPKLTR